MRVGFDLDGCLFDFSKGFCSWLVEEGIAPDLTKHLSGSPCYIGAKDIGCTDEELVAILNHGVDKAKLFVGPPMEGAVEAVQRVYEMGHTVHIITDRRFGSKPFLSQDLTFAWLEENDIPFDTIDFTGDKTVVPTDVFVEDLPKNYDALEAAGSRPYLINREWNEPWDDGRRRIKSVTEYADIIENMTYLSRII